MLRREVPPRLTSVASPKKVSGIPESPSTAASTCCSTPSCGGSSSASETVEGHEAETLQQAALLASTLDLLHQDVSGIARKYKMDEHVVDQALKLLRGAAFSPQAFRLQQALVDAVAAGLQNSEEVEQQTQRVVRAELAAQERKEADALHDAAVLKVKAKLGALVADVDYMLRSSTASSSIDRLRDQLAEEISAARALGLKGMDLQAAEKQRRRLHNLVCDELGQVRVCCRLRPLSDAEMAKGCSPAVQVDDDGSVSFPSTGSKYQFSAAFAPGTQGEIFDECRDLIQSAVDGYGVTIFSYGQTGSGKTYTMFGKANDAGIAQRAISEIFATLKLLPASTSVTVSASVCELYNNLVFDFLKPSRKSAQCSAVTATDLASISEHVVRGESELRALVARCLAQRSTSFHAMNATSSRSHLICTVKISRVDTLTGETLQGRILLCDLAGSERLKKTDSSGAQQREGIEVNKSLTALADVIEAVASKRKQVPYRNHKLTQLMRDSLGGTAKTLMIVSCSPADTNVSETHATLHYASRVQHIVNLRPPAASRRCSAS